MVATLPGRGKECSDRVMSSLETVRAAILERAHTRDRCMVAIAGPPGAGKSTLAQGLVQSLPRGGAKVVPMDGFHYDNTVLDEMGLRGRKGAPETFDYGGFAVLLQRIRSMEASIAIPIFDREADLARAGAAVIERSIKFVLVEGNYLLLAELPWSGLAQYFDVTVFLDVPREELRRRLMQRWIDLAYPYEKAEHWVTTNDMPNVDRVLARSHKGEFSLQA
jgi:pantothenate kinase